MKISFIQLCWYNLIIANIYFATGVVPTMLFGLVFICMAIICLIKAVKEK